MIGIGDIARLAAEEAKSKESTAGSVTTLGASPGRKFGTVGSVPSAKEKGPSSLFIFSSDNFIRKYATMMIEWAYPFLALRNNKVFC